MGNFSLQNTYFVTHNSYVTRNIVIISHIIIFGYFLIFLRKIVKNIKKTLLMLEKNQNL